MIKYNYNIFYITIYYFNLFLEPTYYFNNIYNIIIIIYNFSFFNYPFSQKPCFWKK